MFEIKKTKSGSYHATVYLGKDASGKRKYKSITAPTKREVRQLAEKARMEGAPTACTYDSLTLAQAYERYINSKSNTLSPSTLREYKRAAKMDFPALLPYKLNQLSNEIIQTAVNEISANNSPKTVRNKYYLLCTILKAYHPELRLNIRLPQKKKPKVHTHTEDTIKLLLENADEKIRVPILLAAFAGLRRSEICALTPADFLGNGVLINKAKVRGEGGYIIKQPKTDAGDRFVPMSKELIKECRKWKHFGMDPHELTKRFCNLKKQITVTATFHKLRHYYGTQLIIQGIDLMTACSYGGWDDPEVLLKIYAHETRTQKTDDKVISIYTAFDKKDQELLHKCSSE